MLLLFVDETSDSKFKDYFGLSIAIINSNFYQTLKASFHKILVDSGWDKEIEFKGSYLFSANSGCKDIPVDKRIEIASRILELNKSRENSRIKFAYFQKKVMTTNPITLPIYHSCLIKLSHRQKRQVVKMLLVFIVTGAPTFQLQI